MNAVRDGNHIRIYNAFMIKESIKEIDGRFYDADDKAWLVPFSKENAALLGLLGVTLGDGLMEADDQQEQHEPEEPLIPMPIKATPYQHQIRAYAQIIRNGKGDPTRGDPDHRHHRDHEAGGGRIRPCVHGKRRTGR